MNWQKKRFSESEDRATEVTQVKEERGKRIKKNELSLREIWETIKYTNTHITGVPKEGKEKGEEERKSGKNSQRNNRGSQ